MRQFETGATRNTDVNKYDYEGFFSPLVLERRAQYMNKHRMQSDGNLRDGDNWQKGIPLAVYMKSAFRHFVDWWKEHRGITTKDGIEEAICALLFNCEGYLHELLKKRANSLRQWSEDDAKSQESGRAQRDAFSKLCKYRIKRS